MALLVILLLAYTLAFAFFTGWLAKEKGRDEVTWTILGLFFGIVALLAVGLAPSPAAFEGDRIDRSHVGADREAPREGYAWDPRLGPPPSE